MIYKQNRKSVQKFKSFNCASVLDSSAQGISLQRKADMANNAMQRDEISRPNNTGMPDNLKSGIESLSGLSMDNVRVHFNSSKPATVQALAYTQGTDIHVAPGQEKCLPHEAWHVAQQMAGRVSPTTNINGMPVNDNAALEHEADVMGEKAMQCKNCASTEPKQVFLPNVSVQRFVKEGEYILSKEKNGNRNIAVKENEASTIYIRDGNAIPDDLVKLGIKNTGEEKIKVNGVKKNYRKLQQRKIKKAIECEKDEKNEFFPQKKLEKDDVKKTKSFLNEQLSFVCDVLILNKKLQEKKGKNVKPRLQSLINAIRESFSLKCLGSDIMNGVLAMYRVACEGDFNEMYGSVLKIVEDDLILRKSQIKKELKVADLEPLIQTECSGSAMDRVKLMKDSFVNHDGENYLFAQDKRYVDANFDKGVFPFAWKCHVGSFIEQDLTDDCLFIEDAVGKSSYGRECANAHWFAHIYGADESLVSKRALYNRGEFYPIGDEFLMKNRFNEVSADQLPSEITKLKNNSWNVRFVKNGININLKVTMKENCQFKGSFDIETPALTAEKKGYLRGVMDFMVQTANSAIDGFFISVLAGEGLNRYRANIAQDVKDVNSIVVGYDLKVVCERTSLLSIYKDNLPSQN